MSSAARERAISSIKYSFDSIDGELKLAENDYPARLRFIDRYELEVFGIGSTKGLWERCSLNATGLDYNRMETIFYNPISKLQALTDEKLQVIEKRLEQVNHP